MAHRPVVLGHMLRRVTEDVADYAHGWRRWVDEGVAHHKLLQDVVLDCTLEKVLCRPLLFGRCYVPEASKPSPRTRVASLSARGTMTGGLCFMQARRRVLNRPGVVLHCTLHIYIIPACLLLSRLIHITVRLYGVSAAAGGKKNILLSKKI